MPIQEPPRRDNGNVEPHNHPEILDDWTVIRRISEQFVVPDGSGGKRLSTMAFEPSSGDDGGLSVDIEPLIVEAGFEPKEFVTTPRWMGSVKFEVAELRRQQLLVGYDPLPDNEYHGEVWGAKSKGQKRALLRAAEWFVPIEGVVL